MLFDGTYRGLMTSTLATPLSDHQHEKLSTIAKLKFEAYFRFTRDLERSKADPTNGWYIYPNDSILSDLVVLSAVYSDVHSIVSSAPTLTEVVSADTFLCDRLRNIVNADGSGFFWTLKAGKVSCDAAVDQHLKGVLRTLRNGIAHCHWLYGNLSADAYWKALGWDTNEAPSTFGLPNLTAQNYRMYIADGNNGPRQSKWNPQQAFWAAADLRILTTNANVLRYHLHLALNYLLTGSKTDVFGTPYVVEPVP